VLVVRRSSFAVRLSVHHHFCHPERSEYSAKRSIREVEGPLFPTNIFGQVAVLRFAQDDSGKEFYFSRGVVARGLGLATLSALTSTGLRSTTSSRCRAAEISSAD
jgi:hypothetical protein